MEIGAAAAAVNPKTKVLFIMGWSRSGSTLLANILGELPGFFCVGELSAIWDWGALHNRTCGCGRPFNDCTFWTRVLDRMKDGMGDLDAERWRTLGRKETRTLHAPFFFLASRRKMSSPALGEYLGVTAALYEAVREVSACPVIVDSSKSPFYGGLLDRIPQLDVYYLHLIRDPRAAAYSWSTQKPQPDFPMKRMGAAQSSILWNGWNAAAEWIGRRHPDRYLRIRYEDFSHLPRGTVEAILRLAQERSVPLPFRGEHSVSLGPNHTVRGNPDRFQTGTIEITPDLRWEKMMPATARWTAELLAWPMMLRYGYPL
jgi:hypothetical protein